MSQNGFYNESNNGKGGNYSHGGSTPQGANAQAKPPAVEIGSFYKDGKIQPDLFDKKAKKIADSFCGNKFSGVKSTQIRKIYDEVKRFERLLEINENSWEEQLPYIKMIKSKTSYAVARAKKEKSNAPYYENLGEFIKEGIELIENKKDYQVFLALFEAVYGFYYENKPDDK